MSTIVIKLSGPLQSFGTNSHFETRHTDFYPSKSAIIGLISASLGLKRDEDLKIQKLNELDFAVRIDKKGSLAMDYHTARKYKDNGDFERTYVTNRYYLEDAIFVVFVSSSDENIMNKIENALKYPYFQTYMGRRSCPLAYDFFIGKYSENIIDTISKIKWQDNITTKKPKYLKVYLDSHLSDKKETLLRKDYVISFSQKERKYRYRSEKSIKIPTPIYEHDAISALEE